jgi:hypothetical protein
MHIVAAARGLEDEPLEAVLPIDGSEIDMSAASDVHSQEFTTGAGNRDAPYPDYGKPMNFKDLWHNGAMKNRS